ncbi:hypothetical protein SDC9_90800 [bioreactor metagenome]|uniref:Uncharacterized protein n=1 Tax=bioreactor metagenome TaxID=1076179 RepID=A0A644ZTE3_9ZZZZ
MIVVIRKGRKKGLFLAAKVLGFHDLTGHQGKPFFQHYDFFSLVWDVSPECIGIADLGAVCVFPFFPADVSLFFEGLKPPDYRSPVKPGYFFQPRKGRITAPGRMIVVIRKGRKKGLFLAVKIGGLHDLTGHLRILFNQEHGSSSWKNLFVFVAAAEALVLASGKELHQ